MSSESTTPLNSTLTRDWAWLKAHLLGVAVIAVLVIGSVYGIESLVAAHDSATALHYNQILALQTQQTQTLQKQLSTDEANWAQVEAQLLAQNAQLTKQISQRNQAAAVQVQADASLSAQDSATRIAAQTHASVGEVTAQGNDVTLDLPITRVVVASLDQLPAVESDLADTTKQLANETTVAANAQSDVADAKKVIASQTTQLADADKSCKSQIAVVNAKARRGKLKAFFIGAATVLGLWAGHSL